MRTELECRKPDFEDGTLVLLADGQEWTLPRPRVRLAPANNDRGFKTVLTRPDDGVFAALMARYDALVADEGSGMADLAAVELAVGRHLLTANYDLSETEVAGVLQFSYDEKSDPEGYAVREAVMGVVFGYAAPKPSADGDGSPSSSTA